VAQHAEDRAQLDESLLADLLDHRERIARLLRVVVDEVQRDTRRGG
jgi:hypothetical protein